MLCMKYMKYVWYDNKQDILQWNLRIMDMFGTSHFVLYREVVLPLEVKMY